MAALDQSRNPLIGFFTSLRLTVVCLALALVLVFWGTLAQVDLGLYKAQNEFFRSFFIYWGPKGAAWRIPVFPGGYLIGGVLLINLIASQLRRFTFTASKVGLWMVHVGLILLLLGQLLTDLLSRESMLHLREGEAKNYSETEREAELAVIDATDPDADKVVAIPQGVLAGQKSIQPGRLAVHGPGEAVLRQFPRGGAGAPMRRSLRPPRKASAPARRQRVAARDGDGQARRAQRGGGD